MTDHSEEASQFVGLGNHDSRCVSQYQRAAGRGQQAREREEEKPLHLHVGLRW